MFDDTISARTGWKDRLFPIRACYLVPPVSRRHKIASSYDWRCARHAPIDAVCPVLLPSWTERHPRYARQYFRISDIIWLHSDSASYTTAHFSGSTFQMPLPPTSHPFHPFLHRYRPLSLLPHPYTMSIEYDGEPLAFLFAAPHAFVKDLFLSLQPFAMTLKSRRSVDESTVQMHVLALGA